MIKRSAISCPSPPHQLGLHRYASSAVPVTLPQVCKGPASFISVGKAVGCEVLQLQTIVFFINAFVVSTQYIAEVLDTDYILERRFKSCSFRDKHSLKRFVFVFATGVVLTQIDHKRPYVRKLPRKSCKRCYMNVFHGVPLGESKA